MNNTLWLVILIVIIVIVLEVVVFHRMNETQEERDRQMHKLWLSILITVIVAIVLLYLLKDYGGKSGEGDEEYGYFDTLRENIRNAKERRKVAKEAEKATGSKEAGREAARKKKQEQREVKIAGQDAAREARQKKLDEQRARGRTSPTP